VNQQRLMRQRRLGTAVDPDRTCPCLGTPLHAKRKGATANLKRNDVSHWILVIWLAEWLSRDVLTVTSVLVTVWLFQVFGHRCQDGMLVGDRKGKGDYLRRRGVRRAPSHASLAPTPTPPTSPRTLLSSVWSPTQDSVSSVSQWITVIICLVYSSIQQGVQCAIQSVSLDSLSYQFRQQFQVTMSKGSGSGVSQAATPDSSTVRQYVVPLLAPGAPGSPYFDGTRVTDFLSQYNNMCDSAGLSDVSRVRHLTRYCGSDTARYLYTLPEYRSELWRELQSLMKKEYRDRDPVQHQQSIQYLEQLKNSKMKSVKQYCRVFKTTADAVLKKKQITEYQCGLWFLQGLPESLAAKLMRKHGVDIEEPDTVNFEKLHDSVIKYVVEDEQLAALKRTGWDSTRDPLEAFAAPSIILPVPSAATAPAGKMPVERAQQRPLLEGYEDDLSDQLRKMMIKVVRGMQEGIREDGYGRAFSNSELRNGQRGSGTITPAGPDPARNINNQQSGLSITCYFCGKSGHITTRCFTLGDYIRSGKVHRNQDGKYILGLEGQRSVSVPMDRTRPTKEVIDEMLPSVKS
jgi:hypothetical protein